MSEKILKITLTVCAVVSILVITGGILAIPVVLAWTSGIWYWMFLYLAYLIGAALAVLYVATTFNKLGGSQNENNKAKR